MFKRKTEYTIGSVLEKRKKLRSHAQALFIWALIIGWPLSWWHGYGTGIDVTPLAGEPNPPLSGEELTLVTNGIPDDWNEDDWITLEAPIDDVVVVGDVATTNWATDELYWITHYGPPTFAPSDVTAWGMSIAESLIWADLLSEEWGTPIKGICASHKYTPWYAKNIYPPVLLKVEGRGNYLVLDRKGINDAVGIDIYEPDQDGPMYCYRGEVTEIVGWWCE